MDEPQDLSQLGAIKRKEGIMPPKYQTYLVEVVREGVEYVGGRLPDRKERVLLAATFLRLPRGLTDAQVREALFLSHPKMLEGFTPEQVLNEVVVNVTRPFAKG